ncbi:MAG: proton-conducting transporter membrane subunit, partial [Caldilineaceae bacterium]
ALLLAARFPQGRSFVPMTLALLAGYMLWYMVQSAPVDVVLVQPLGLILLSALSAIALQAGRPVRAAGPVRWMVAPVLAFPLFLIANYYIQLAPLNPQETAPLQTASVLLTFGLLLLMAPVPLHSVAPTTSESAPPVATALFTLLYQLALISLIARMVGQYAFMQTLAPLNIWFAWAGLMTAIWAGVAAVGSEQPGRLWGYVALHDWGLILLLLSVPGLRTWSLVIFIFLLRVISMLTAAAGLAALEANVHSLEPERLHGAGVRLPWNSAAYLMGCLGLVGFPLSAGFAGHWAALQLVAASDWRPAVAVLIASGAAILALIRMARMLYGPMVDPSLIREKPLGVATAVLMLIISIALALAPQLLNGPVSRAILSLGT